MSKFPRFYIAQNAWPDENCSVADPLIADRIGIFDPLPCRDRLLADFVVDALNRNHERIVAEREYAAKNAPHTCPSTSHDWDMMPLRPDPEGIYKYARGPGQSDF